MEKGYRLRFQEMQENKKSHSETFPIILDDDKKEYERNLCLELLDGKLVFVNYAYLLYGECDMSGVENQIKLVFSSYHVFLSGYGLKNLFLALKNHLPEFIKAIDPRYVSEDDIPVVTGIRIEENN